MSFAVYPQPDACRAWMPTTPMPPGASPPSPPMVCHMPKGHDGQHSNERRPSTLSRRWDGDARPAPAPAPAGRAADDETVERVARAMFDSDYGGTTFGWDDQAEGPDVGKAYYRRHARAAVAALRGDEGEAT